MYITTTSSFTPITGNNIYVSLQNINLTRIEHTLIQPDVINNSLGIIVNYII